MHLIACADLNWGIGRCGKEIANIPTDKKFFKEKTMGSTVIMGRKTYESLPPVARPLPGRTNIVISRNSDWVKETRKEYQEKVLSEPEKLKGTTLILTKNINGVFNYIVENENTWLIGGGKMYQDLYKYCSDAYITRISCSLGADTFMPNLDADSDWMLNQQITFDEESYDYLHYSIYHYVNKNNWLDSWTNINS